MSVKEINPLEERLDRLERTVECLMIAREGIQELDGYHTMLYNKADEFLTRKTRRLREDLKRKEEKYEIENQIEVLKQRLLQYD